MRNRQNYRQTPTSELGITPPQRFVENGFGTTGRQRGLVLLAQFPDLPFTVGDRSRFEALLNARNYTNGGATGSAWQYYYDNSNGRFDPEFVVVGPYTLTHERSYYTAYDDNRAYEMILEVCRQAYADGIDLAQYANEGVMRDLFVFYAGGNEADGSDPNGIWPHRYDVSYQGGGQQIGGVQPAGYACASELSADTQGNIGFTSIGTFCHEFGHVLGWPDLYDTDYDDNGYALGPYTYSLMATGSYNNEGRTPPALSILERWMVGWAEPIQVSSTGEYALGSVCSDNGYLIATPQDNDYFLLEYRGAGEQVWDNPDYYNYTEQTTASGLLAYHIDYSLPNRWLSNNTVNAYANHECVKVVCSVPNAANAAAHPAYSFFPGGSNVTRLASTLHRDFRSWKEEQADCYLTDIRVDNGAVKFRAGSTPYGMYDYETERFQHDALLTWKDDIGTSWSVSWRQMGTTTDAGTKTVTDRYVHLDQLKVGRRYEYTIRNSDGVTYTSSFGTLSKGQNQPHIEVSPELPEAGTPLLLHLTDCNDFSSVTWYVDDNPQDAYTTLAAGEHRIQAEITLDDGSKEYILRYITIR